MARRTLQPEGRANPGMEEKQVTKSHNNSFPFFVPFPPPPKEQYKDEYITRIPHPWKGKQGLIQLKSLPDPLSLAYVKCQI